VKAGVYNINVDQGADFTKVITLKDSSGNPVNLTGYSARMHVRRDVDSASTLVELTTQNGRISLGGAAGTITLALTATTTAGIARSGVYDIEIVSAGGQVSRVLRGDFVVDREVTR
jgi:hypothetical protein